MSRPWGVSSWMRSARMRMTIAVDDMAIAPPTASAPCHGAPTRAAAANTAPSVSTTWAKPSPNTRLAAVENSLGQAEFQPDGEHQEHDAEFRKMPPFVGVGNPRQCKGSHGDTDQEISEQRRQLQPAKEHHDEHRARQQDQHQFKRVAHSEVLVFLGSRREKCGIGLVYSLHYDKGCSQRRPARFSSMNDRSKKAISTSALELARKVLAIEADAVSGTDIATR